MTAGGAGVCLTTITGAGSLFVGGEVSLVVITLAAGVAGWGGALAATAGNGFGTSTGCIAPASTDTRRRFYGVSPVPGLKCHFIDAGGHDYRSCCTQILDKGRGVNNDVFLLPRQSSTIFN